MSTYTDGLWPTPTAINIVDPTLQPALLSQCGTNLLSLCDETYSHCAQIIASKLQSVIGATNFNPSGGATALHNAAIIWGVRAQSNVVRLRMGQIIMNDLYTGSGPTPNSLTGPISTWMTYWAIVLGYRKMIGRVDPTKDVYLGKYNRYKQITAGEKWSLFRSTGIPYCRLPFPAPGALYEPGSGTWNAANITQTSHTGATGGIFQVAITWVCQTSPVFYVNPLTKNNAESGPSLVHPDQFPTGILQTTVTTDNVMTISIANLTPPTGSIPLPEASITGVSQGTMIATGWNIYVGLVSGPPSTTYMYLQNATPIPVGVTSFTLPGDPTLSGYTMGPGQYPDANMPMADLMMRM